MAPQADGGGLQIPQGEELPSVRELAANVFLPFVLGSPNDRTVSGSTMNAEKAFHRIQINACRQG